MVWAGRVSVPLWLCCAGTTAQSCVHDLGLAGGCSHYVWEGCEMGCVLEVAIRAATSLAELCGHVAGGADHIHVVTWCWAGYQLQQQQQQRHACDSMVVGCTQLSSRHAFFPQSREGMAPQSAPQLTHEEEGMPGDFPW
jgi:hypothetical protein